MAWWACAAPGNPIRFEDVAARSGIDFTLRNSATPQKHQIETMPGGVAVFDFDNDGKPDIYFTNGATIPDLKKAEQIEVKRYQDRIFKYMGASGALDELATYFNFTFTNASDKPFFVLDLEPKTKGIAKRVKHIRIWIDRASYLTTKFEYAEGDGDVTRYEFTNVKINQPVAQGRFVLSLPPSVRVEQMRLQ